MLHIRESITSSAHSNTSDFVGRYQAMPTKSTSAKDRVFTLDTITGNYWVWYEGTGGSELVYQGKVKKGKKVGETILKTEK